MNQPDLSGFDPRVQDQLAQLSLEQETRSNSDSRSHSSYHSVSRQSNHNHNQYNTYIHPHNMHRQHPAEPRYNASWNAAALGPDAFPPLGSTRPAPTPTANMNAARNHYQQQQAQANVSAYNSQNASTAAQDFFSRARGAGRARGRPHRQDNTDFTRAPPRQNNNWSTQNQSFAYHDQHRGFRHRAIEQADFLNYVAQETMNMLPRQEIEQKHAFRLKLESLAKTVSEKYTSLDPDPKSLNIRLQSYGSLSNSFGTTGCDVDLLLTAEKNLGEFVEITEKYKRDLEKALLDLGIGARLLTNTRIPIIRVCERPTSALLENLKENRRQREVAELSAQTPVDPTDLTAPLPLLPKSRIEEQSAALAQLDLNAADVPLPNTPVIDHAKLEFVGDCGIQCDINFTNHVALHNTKMLWTYGQCDVRVRHMGIFVKNWAKARAINTPYHGTLSSYGYILMVLQYLMNVANPPVIPNLQDLARRESWEKEPANLFEGHDIRYIQDLNSIRDRMANAPKNQNSLGALLHGFFRYYASHDGFNWTQDVISIRSFGGILSKQAKGWTGAKWTGTKQNVRLRYLLAIEDPFELEHNVARTVGHNGIKAIRDEFRRAWTIIQGVQRQQDINGTSWVWTTHNRSASGDGLDLVKPSEDRGDLLKKDADFRKEQLRLLKQKTEADEELARKLALTGTSEDELGDSYGMSSGRGDLPLIDAWAEDQSKLIHDIQLQDRKVTRMRGPDPYHRKPTTDEDDTDSEDPTTSEWHVGSNERPYSKYIDEWATADNLVSSELGSEDWRTAYETTSPATERHDEVHADHDKVTNDHGLWDSWNNDPPSNDLADHDDTVLDWNDDQRQVVSDDWDTPYPHEQSTAETTKNDRMPPQQITDWNDDTNQWDDSADRAGPEPMSPRTKRQLRSSQPLPQPFDDIPQLPRDAPTKQASYRWQYNEEDQKPDRVGSFIKWSPETVGGRWLLNRDAQIRDGKRIELTAGDRGRLSAKFPYNPDMTQQQLADKNDLLEKYYKNSLYSRRSSEMQSISMKAENAVIKAPSTVTEESWGEQETENRKTDINRIIDAGLVGDGIYWSTMTGVGSWLCWRDRKILAGLWNPRDSLAALLTEVFPRKPEMTVADQNRMNWELDNFFAGLDYPRPNQLTREEMDEAAEAIRDAIQRTQSYRASKFDALNEQSQSEQVEPLPYKPSWEQRPRSVKTTAPLVVEDDQTVDSSSQKSVQSQHTPTMRSYASNKIVKNNEQSKVLLDMFKSEGEVSPKATRHILDPEDRNVINERSMQAIIKLSEQASSSREILEDLEFVRARRLAFFEQSKRNDEVTESVPMKHNPSEQNFDLEDERRDSATEGSWNRSNPSSYDIEKLRADDSFW